MPSSSWANAAQPNATALPCRQPPPTQPTSSNPLRPLRPCGLLRLPAFRMLGQSEVVTKPNKPVLPTADTWPNKNPPGSMRRQTGQPLGSLEGGAGNATMERFEEGEVR